MKSIRRPQAVMMSKRANVFYLEYVRVFQKDECVVYGSKTQDGLQQLVNIPDKNSAFLLLGKGSSITDSAMRMLAESNVIVGFCGSGGAPLHGLVDPVFMTPQDEYRPTEYMQAWAKSWFDDAQRLELAKKFQRYRVKLCVEEFKRIRAVPYPLEVADRFLNDVEAAESTRAILGSEAAYAKALYRIHAQHYQMPFVRDPGGRKASSRTEPERLANSFVDHCNYLAYGYAAVALHTLGISYALPVLHGKTRRGGLVFDVADLLKDWLVMPAAFEMASETGKDNEFRARLIDTATKRSVMDRIMNFLKETCEDI